MENRVPEGHAAHRVLRPLGRHLGERFATSIEPVTEGAELVLGLDPTLPLDAFSIARTPEGATLIAGQGQLGLLHGIGRFLRDGQHDGQGFAPGSWKGTDAPECPVRGIYFAFHNNWYSNASFQELSEYIEDLALWGLNTVLFHFPQADDPQSAFAGELRERHRSLLGVVKVSGMKAGLLKAPNVAFESTPESILGPMFPDTVPPRRGDAGKRVCPSNPEGFAYLSIMLGEYLDGYTDIGIDFVAAFPYDSGGCGCDQCWPWGARGFVKLSKEFSRLAHERYPACEFVLCTWCYDVCEQSDGEYEGLEKVLAEDKSWVQYIMADAHGDFPRYPLEHGSPGGLPLINFAEISMWGRFPWGGSGANPFPVRLQDIWDQSGAHLAGGFPYSEGKFEDINKVLFARYFWNRASHERDTLREYIAYEFSPGVVEGVAEAIYLLERNLPRATQQLEEVVRAHNLLMAADRQLRPERAAAWRWRILLLRSIIDYEIATNNGTVTERCNDAYEELLRIFHLENGWRAVAPPARSYLERHVAKGTIEERPPGSES